MPTSTVGFLDIYPARVIFTTVVDGTAALKAAVIHPIRKIQWYSLRGSPYPSPGESLVRCSTPMNTGTWAANAIE